VGWMPSGVASLGNQIDRLPSFTLGQIALYFELRARWQSHGPLFGYRAASVFGGRGFFMTALMWTGQQTRGRDGNDSKG